MTGRIYFLTIPLLCHLAIAFSYRTSIVSPNCFEEELVEDFSGSGQVCRDIDSALGALESGMTLSLEPGIHVIRRPHFNDTRGLWGVSITGSGVNETVITCEEELGLAFVGMVNLFFRDFTITNCGLTGMNLELPLTLLKESLDLWILVPLTTHVALFIGDCRGVIIQDVHITNTTGLGLLGINIMGSSILSGVSFTRNIRPQCLKDSEPNLPSLISSDIYDQVGGGAYFLYSDYHSASVPIGDVSLYLIDCYFAYNADCTYMSVISINFPFYTINKQGLYKYAVGAGGGLSVVLENSYFEVDVAVSDTTFYRNDARYGGGAFVATFAGFRHPVTVVFSECTFLENGVASLDNDGILRETHCQGGGGLSIFTDLVKPKHFVHSIPSPNDTNLIVGLLDSIFSKNHAVIQGGGVMAYSFFSTPHANLDVRDPNHYSIFWVFHNTTFTENFARYSSAAYLTQFANLGVGGSVWVVIENIDVSKNYNQKSSNFFLGADEEACAVHLKEVTCTVDGNRNTFTENRGSALRVESTFFTVFNGASVTFHQNLAHRGGALHFTGNSPGVLVYPNVDLSFIGNKAVIEGGAIYYDPLGTPLEILQPLNNFGCFIITSLTGGSRNPGSFGLFTSNISVTFANNTAPLGGIVFGTSMEYCAWALNISRDGLSLYQILYGYNSTFIFSEEPTGKELVSTLPAYLNVSLLNSIEQPVTVFPGQTIEVGIKVFDAYGSIIPEVVTSVIDNRTIPAISTLGNSGFWHTSVYESELRITGMYKGLLNVSIVTETNSLSSTFSVNLTSCPVGFFIDSVNQRCTCDEFLQNTSGVHCFEDSVSFSAFRDVWIGTDPSIENPNSSDLIVHRCLLNYCKTLSNSTINPPDFNTQCSSNRAGLLCGDCSEGYSVVFGSNECLQCSNYWLFLIPVFALAGAVLFAGLALLEITIDKGLTNVALFFACLVSFFDFLTPNLYSFLPFRLLGLQLGVSTCFYDGMDALHRSFLLLVFPIYLYTLMAIFAILCRRFTWMSVHFSPAKTLATLTVMCHLSVLTICIDLIVAIKIESLGGNSSYRWIINPRWLYFQGVHGLLATLGFVVILLYIIPFPLVLLFPPLSYRYLQRLSPFLDVIWEAYKPKLRFWLGVRVIVLTVLFLVTRASLVYAYIFSGMIIVVFSNLQAFIQPFKDKWANYADTVLITLTSIYFWGAQAISRSDYTLSIQVLAKLYVTIFALISYSIYLIMFALHMHRQFPFIWPKLVEKIRTTLKKNKKSDPVVVSRTVVGIDRDEQNEREDNLRTFNLVTRSSVYVAQPPHVPSMFIGSPRYRESLLGSVEPVTTNN